MPHPLNRRAFLRGSGICLALPLLDAMQPAHGAGTSPTATPRRMVAIETNMGILPQFFFPEKAGKDYALTPYLERLGAHRKNMTVFSGVSLPGVTGRPCGREMLSDRHAASRTRRLSQLGVARSIRRRAVGNRTRYPSLTLAMSSEGGMTLSYTRSGAPISAERSPRKLFQKLFVQGKPEEVKANVEALRQGRSMLDFVGDQAKAAQSVAVQGRPAAHGPVFHFGSRTRTASAQLGGVGIQAKAESERAAARMTSTIRGSSSRRPSSCSTSSSWHWRPTPRASSRCSSTRRSFTTSPITATGPK